MKTEADIQSELDQLIRELATTTVADDFLELGILFTVAELDSAFDAELPNLARMHKSGQPMSTVIGYAVHAVYYRCGGGNPLFYAEDTTQDAPTSADGQASDLEMPYDANHLAILAIDVCQLLRKLPQDYVGIYVAHALRMQSFPFIAGKRGKFEAIRSIRAKYEQAIRLMKDAPRYRETCCSSTDSDKDV